MSAGSGTLGKYQIIREIARSNDIVYEAYDPVMNRRVAVKELNLPAGVTDKLKGERLSRFVREAKAAGSLAHQNIVTIYEVGQDGDRHFIAMEYLEGQTLRQRLDAEGFLPQDEAIRIIGEVLDGLSYAHEHGIIHRDIKPDNIQLLPDKRVKITDFGIARLTFEPSLTMDGQIFGTPSYMSPEQVVGREIDARTDIFSCGVVLYETIAGKKPFSGDSVVSISHAIMHTDPPDPQQASFPVAQAIRKALDKSPELRYNSAKNMASALRDAIQTLVSDPTMAPMPGMGQTVYQTSTPWGLPLDPYGAPPQTTPYGTPVPPPQTQYGYSTPSPYGSPYGQPYGSPNTQPYSQQFPPAPYPTGWVPPPRKPFLSPGASDFLAKTFWVVLVGLMIVGLGFAAIYAMNQLAQKGAATAGERRTVDRAIRDAGSASNDESIQKLRDAAKSIASESERQKLDSEIASRLMTKGDQQANEKDWAAAYATYLEAAQSQPSAERFAAAGNAARESGRKETEFNKRLDWYNLSREAYMRAYNEAQGQASESDYKQNFLDAATRQAVELASARRFDEANQILSDTFGMVPMTEEEAREFQQMMQDMTNGG